MVISRTFGFCLLSLFVLPSQSSATTVLPAAWNFDRQEVSLFERGKVVNRAQSLADDVEEVTAFLQIEAPIESIFYIIIDYESLPEYMPNLASVEVLENTNSMALVNYHLSLPFGVKKSYRLKLEYDIQPHESWVSWQLVPQPSLKADETITSTVGFFHLIKANTPHRTWLHYDTQTNPGGVPFGLGWLVEILTQKTVVKMLEETKERAEKKWQTTEINSDE